MKKQISYLALLVVITLFTVSCNKNPTLQTYFVESNNNNEFISVDIPSSVLSLKNKDASDEVKETLKSIKKVNFLGFQVKDDNIEKYKKETKKIKTILANPKYQDLFSIGGKRSLAIKYLGEDDAIDEIIIFGADIDKGFILVRLLGKKMNPSKMKTLIDEINYDGNMDDFKQFESLLSK